MQNPAAKMEYNFFIYNNLKSQWKSNESNQYGNNFVTTSLPNLLVQSFISIQSDFIWILNYQQSYT